MRLINLIVMLASLTVIAAYAFEIWRVLRGQRRFSLGFALCAVIFPLFFGATVVAAYQAKPISAGGLLGFLPFVALILYGLLRKSFTQAGDDGDQILRGSTLVSGTDMMTSLYGNKTVKQIKKAPHRAEFITLGEVAVPSSIEAQHLLFSGATGSGKTQGINRVLQAVRARQHRALVADAGGSFVSRFFQPGDVIFNPFDSRSVGWSPFAEIRAEYDCARIAKAAIPDGHGDGQEWHHYAQTLLGETLLALVKRDRRSVTTLLHYLTNADSKELGELLSNTPAAILCVKGNEKMLANTRGIISTYLLAWRYLPDQGQFSVRRWVQDDGQTSWLFVTFRDDQLGLLRLLVATILELATVEGLSLAEDPERDLWFILDEADSLGKVSSLRAGLTKLRKYGCKVVVGLQTIAQFRATYGHDEAQTLLANIATKVILRAGDGETAEYFSTEFGDQEITRMQWSQTEGYSQGTGILNPGNASHSTANTQIREHKRTILASEIAGLPDLHGYLKLPGAPIGAIRLEYTPLPEVAPAYQESGIALLKPSQNPIPGPSQNPDPSPIPT